MQGLLSTCPLRYWSMKGDRGPSGDPAGLWMITTSSSLASM